VAFTVDAFPGRHFPGRITQLRYQSTTTNNVVTYLAEISVNNREMLLRPGMTATAVITVNSVERALLVPNVALRFSPALANVGQATDGRSFFRKLMPGPPPMPDRTIEAEDETASSGPHVWVLRDGRPSAVAVKTGITNGKLTEIVSGAIAPGVPLVVESVRAEK
jgi:HlyD family secretion protein